MEYRLKSKTLGFHRQKTWTRLPSGSCVSRGPWLHTITRYGQHTSLAAAGPSGFHTNFIHQFCSRLLMSKNFSFNIRSVAELTCLPFFPSQYPLGFPKTGLKNFRNVAEHDSWASIESWECGDHHFWSFFKKLDLSWSVNYLLKDLNKWST